MYGGDKYDVDEEDGGEDDGSELDGDYDAAVSTTEEEFASCSEATVKARCLIQLYKEVTGRLVTSPICWGRNGAFKADPVFQGQRRSTSIYSVPQQSRASRLVSRSSPSYTGAVLRLPVYQSAVYVKAEATLKISICSVTNEVRVANSRGRHPNNSYLLQIVDVTYSLPISLRIRSR